MSSINNMQGLVNAYGRLSSEQYSPEEAISLLNVDLKGRIRTSVERFASSADVRDIYRGAIRNVALEFYESSGDSLQGRMHGIFYKICGVSCTGDREWGRHHIQDSDKTVCMLRTVE